MRTLVDIDAADIAALDDAAARAKESRAAIIREAIRDYLRKHRVAAEADAFGLWGKSKVDGLAFQRKARAEW